MLRARQGEGKGVLEDETQRPRDMAESPKSKSTDKRTSQVGVVREHHRNGDDDDDDGDDE